MDKRTQELLDRTFLYAVNTANVLMGIPDHHVVNIYKRQLARSSSSIGANYEEAQAAASKRDFAYKVGICLKEARESVYWCRLMVEIITDNQQKEKIKLIASEAIELKKIFSSISLSAKKQHTINV